MEEVEIPSYFLCPISLQLMRDPVTLPTGITYDRESIETWLYSGKHDNCPVTKQQVSGCELIPNHTLRRLIQSWCSLNASHGIQTIPTPKAPLDRAEFAKLLEAAATQPTSLSKIKLILQESEANKHHLAQTPGAVNLLGSILSKTPDHDGAAEEALCILTSLKLSEEAIVDLVANNHPIIKSLASILKHSRSTHTRSRAVELLRSIAGAVAPSRLRSDLPDELFEQVVRLIEDRVSLQATKSALHVLAGLCTWGRNRVRAVEVGGVHAVVELLLDESERRANELGLVVLDKMCGCAEGREKLVGHRAGVHAVAKKVMRVSRVGSERAVRVLHSVGVRAGEGLAREMAQCGVAEKLWVVLQGEEIGERSKEKVREILRVHSRVWRSSPCLSVHFKNLYSFI